MRAGGEQQSWKVIPVAPEARPVFVSPDPGRVCLGSPAIAAFPGGRLVVAFDQQGPGVKRLPGVKGRLPGSGNWVQGKVLVSGIIHEKMEAVRARLASVGLETVEVYEEGDWIAMVSIPA